MDWATIKYFKPEEFADPEFPWSWTAMDPKSILLLEWLRRHTGWPIVTHNKFGLRGCVCVKPVGHSPDSRHYKDHPEGCSAIDWHFVTDADPRDQAREVLASGFSGIGIYQFEWKWKGALLPIAFHTDRRRRFQVWRRKDGEYCYLLS